MHTGRRGDSSVSAAEELAVGQGLSVGPSVPVKEDPFRADGQEGAVSVGVPHRVKEEEATPLCPPTLPAFWANPVNLETSVRNVFCTRLS